VLEGNQMDIRMVSAAEDMETVRGLVREYGAWLGIDLNWQGFEEELAGLPGSYAEATGGGLWLLEEGGAVAGCVGVRRIGLAGEKKCELKRMYVREGFRGRGAGRRLGEVAIAWAKGRGYREMYLDTLSRLTTAIGLYESLGFVQCEAYYENPVPNVVYFVKAL